MAQLPEPVSTSRLVEQVPVRRNYRALTRSMLLIGFFLPFVPTVAVAGLIVFQYQRTWPASAADGLNQGLVSAAAAVAVAGTVIAANAFSLSRKMVCRIQLADRKQERMVEQMLQTGKLAAIGELAAGIAHEINNPVAIMVEEAGWISDLLEDQALDQHPDKAEIERAARQIQTQGKRCKEITHKLLSFARETDFSLTEVELPALIDDVLRISAKRAEDGEIEIRTEIQDGLPTALLPQTELQQVLFNLVNNGFDSMEGCPGDDSGGRRLSISVTAEQSTLRIAVTDTGAGIPEQDQRRIFDPFFTTKPVGKGTGLGLSICYGIIKRIGGNISVDSAPGAGASFVIRLPLVAGGEHRASEGGR